MTQRFLSLPIAVLLAACAPAPSPDAPAPDAGDTIELRRGPCFGACPVYRLTIRGDGSIRFVGERFVGATGEHTATIDSTAAATLFALADSIGFFGLPANITPSNQQACGSSWTDMPSAETTIGWGDRSHTVHHYHGCPNAPESLTELENRIDEVAGTARWIGQG